MDSFWDFFWFTISFFLLMAYLVVLFQILTDLFRDRDTSGWSKAFWVFFLIVLPLITSLIYLISKGQGMAERNIAAAQSAQADADAYIRSVATSASPRTELPGDVAQIAPPPTATVATTMAVAAARRRRTARRPRATYRSGALSGRAPNDASSSRCQSMSVLMLWSPCG